MAKNQNIIFTAGGMSPIHVLQAISLAFCVGGCGLAFMLGTGPREALSSSSSKIIWAAGLAVIAVVAPILSWYYGRKIAARIALSEDGKSAWIKDANLVGATDDQWPVSALEVTGFLPGDPKGEEATSPPRVTLRVSKGTTHREYIVPLRGKQQLARLRDGLHISQRTIDNA